MRKNFRFSSSKLGFVCRELGLSGKLDNSGHDLWVRCMDAIDGIGDPKDGKRAQDEMARCCRQDVRTTTELCIRLLPYINHPPYGAITGQDTACTNCGSSDLRKGGAGLYVHGLLLALPVRRVWPVEPRYQA